MNLFKKKDSTNKKDIQKVIEERIKEYDSAIQYFKANELENQSKKGEEDKKLLIELLEKVKAGKEEVKPKDIPKEITPEYINGCSNDERIKKYFEIITKIIDEKQKLQTELENEIKELKKLNKNQILSMKDEIQKDFEKIKNKKIKYDEIINILKEDFQNKWIPPPLYSETDEDTKIEIINEDVPENTIRIIFGETDYLKSNKNVFIKAKLLDTNHEDTWEQKAAGNWSHVIEWQLDEKEYKEIPNKKFHFDVYEKLKTRDKFKAEGDIDLQELKNNKTISDNYKFLLQTRRTEPFVKITFKIRKSIEPKTETVKRRIFCFTKFYPAFKEES